MRDYSLYATHILKIYILSHEYSLNNIVLLMFIIWYAHKVSMWYFAIWQIIFKMENITTFPSQSDYLICLVNHAWPNSLSFFKDLIYLISKTISICKRKFFKSSRHAYESMNWFCRSSIISSWYYELNDIIDIRCIYTCHIIYLKLHFYLEL